MWYLRQTGGLKKGDLGSYCPIGDDDDDDDPYGSTVHETNVYGMCED